MCQSKFDVHFCTCSSINKAPLPVDAHQDVDLTTYEKTYFIWTLYRYVGDKEDLMMGEMMMPVKSLGEGLSSIELLLQLNSRNRFDFNYAPLEGDNLQIREEYIYKSIKKFSRPELCDYMSFIFRNGCWNEEVYDIFNIHIRRFKKGTISKI